MTGRRDIALCIALFGGALLSAALGSRLPGPVTIYLGQGL